MALTTWNEPNLSAAERATQRLRGRYEQFGYKKYHLGQFEEYGLYLQFKSFLTGGRILSFTDLDGRLLALKPDVTLSIAKNARLDGGAVKAYYIENVYRESVASGAMKEISQMGLEYLGGSGSFDETLARARGLCLNGRMTAALDELNDTARAVGDSEALRLDFTLQGDMEYYDGLMMAGYLDGVPNAVLYGGRYDGLMKKLGREMCAVGFALYLDELKRLPRERTQLDVDALVLAGPDADAAGLLAAVREKTAQGLRVRVEAERPAKLRYGSCYRYREGGLEEC